jgi:hypothetical protein
LGSSRDFNKLVIKAKMHAKTFSFFWNFIVWKYNLKFFFFRDLAVCMKTKHFFYILIKTRYFNTGFVSLQYKNTNQYWSKCSKIFAKNDRFFEIIFEEIFLFSGWAQPGPCGWAGPSHLVTARASDPTSHARVKFYACMEHCEGN